MNLLDQQTVTFWATEEIAQGKADANQADDPDWTYTVKAWPEGFVVEIYDEDGELVGTL